MIRRRAFLQSLGLGAAAVMSPWSLGRLMAAPSPGAKRNFIFAFFSGGWDQLMALDPRDPALFTEARSKETKIQLAWERLPAAFKPELVQPAGSQIAFGPAIGNFAKHFRHSCVVRGIAMDTVTHEVGRRYMITGKPPRGLTAAGSAIGTLVAAQQGDHSPIPHLVSRVETYNEGEPSYASGLVVSSVSDLISALQDGPQAPPAKVRALIDAYRAGGQRCDPGALDDKGLQTLVRGAQRKARQLVESGIARLFNFTDKADGEMLAIKERYGITSMTSGGAQAAMAYQALRHGLAQSVSIELARGLDTHDTNWSSSHAPLLSGGFNALAQLVDDLAATPHAEGGTLLDRTTICAFSEFSRSPLINSRQGRDHHLAGSCVLIGAGVPHNQVVGATSDLGMNPESIDPQSGKPDPKGLVLTPTRLMASLLEGAGLSTAKLRSDGLPCLKANA